MVSIVTNGGLGLTGSSKDVLGGAGQLGAGGLGQAGGQVIVNARTGNLILQQADEHLVGLGLDIGVVRTYNSQASFDFDNNDGWQVSLYRKLGNLTGSANSAGSAVTLFEADGRQLVFAYDTTAAAYINKDGGGAYDTLVFNSSGNSWVRQDGDSGAVSQYLANPLAGGEWRISGQSDRDGNTLAYGYNSASGLIDQITNANGETTRLNYNAAKQLTSVETVVDGISSTRVRYAYDAQGRLASVITDLSPQDGSIADGAVYTTSYTYVGTTNRVASLVNSDGTSASFTYDGAGRVSTSSDGAGKTTTYSYVNATTTTVTDPLGLITTLSYDAAGNLTRVQGPAGSNQDVRYTYNASGDLVQLTDSRGNATTYAYDLRGNLLRQQDASGNVVERTYNSANQLASETAYLQPDTDGAGPAQAGAPQTTRYVYDTEQHLRFSISAEGRVAEYRYNVSGRLVSRITYAGAVYGTTGNAPGESELAALVATYDQTNTQRIDTAYDARGLVSTVTRYATTAANGSGVVDGNESTTRYVYDAAGRLLQQVDPRGVASTANTNDYLTAYTYDGLGRVLTVTAYDRDGNALGSGTTARTLTTYTDSSRRSQVQLSNGLVRVSNFDARGLLVSQVEQDSLGAVLSSTNYQYDANGRLRVSVDPTGQKSYLFYDAAGRVTGAIDPAGALTETVYNANGQAVRTIRYASPATAALATLFSADANGVVADVSLAVVRPAEAPAADRITYKIYDAAGRVARSVDALGYVTEYRYDGKSQITDTIRYSNRLSDAQRAALKAATAEIAADDVNAVPVADAANDRRTRSFYSADGLLLAVLDGEGYLIENRYDAAAQRIQTTRYATRTNSAHWASGSLDSLRPGQVADDQVSRYFYDGEGRLVASLDAEGYLSESIYDVAGNLTSSTRYATPTNAVLRANGTLLDIRPATGSEDQTAQYQYDANNRVIVSKSLPGDATTVYTYDRSGNLVQTVSASGTADQRVSQRTYDLQGRLIGEISGEGVAVLMALSNPTQAQIDSTLGRYQTQYRYDAAGRRIAAITPDGNGGGGNATLFYYDVDGRLVHSINALGEVTEYRYNLFGERTAEVSYASRIPSSTLAGLSGGLVSALGTVISGLANPALDRTVLVSYNQRGEAIQSTDALGLTGQSTYNAFGESVSVLTPITAQSNVATLLAYDRRGQLATRVDDAGGLNRQTSQQYDAFGRAVQTVDAQGHTSLHTYDRLGRQVASRDAAGAVRTSTYDAFDRVLSRTDALGNQVVYSYNSAARSFTVTTAEGVSATTVKNRHGETVSVADALGATTTYTYSRNGELKTVTTPAGISSNAYDTAGHLIQTTDARGTITTFAYDAAGRVLSKTTDPSGLALTTRYRYDAFGEVAWEQDPNGIWTRTDYDAKGQVIAEVRDPAMIPDPSGALVPNPGSLNLKTAYSYDGRGKKLTVTTGADSTDARTTHYVYDTLGRRTREIVDAGVGKLNLTTVYAYDQSDNLVAKTDANGGIARYFYDDANRLVLTLDPLNGVRQSFYDAEGQLVRTIAYATALTGLSANPALAEVQGKIVIDATRDRVARTVHDRDGRQVFSIDALNQVTETRYDAAGRIIRTIAYATPVNVGATPSASEVRAVLATSVADEMASTVYDAAGRAVFAIDSARNVVETIYDAAGNAVRTIAYNAPIAASTPINEAVSPTQNVAAIRAGLTVDGARDRITRTVHDAAGRVVFIIDAQNYVKETQYDKLGQIVKTIQYAQTINVSETPSAQEVSAALQPDSAVSSTANRTDTLYATPQQPYTYSATAHQDTATPASETATMTSATSVVAHTPVQPYVYAASSRQDTVVPAQRATLTVESNITPQSAVVKNYAWTRSGNTLVQTTGISLDVGTATRTDNTPTQVKATIYRSDGTVYGTVLTEVGYNSTDSWSEPYQYWVSEGESGYYATAYNSYSATRWNAVTNWAGQVNLSAGSMPADTYTVVIETKDAAVAAISSGAFFDGTDGTWTVTNTVTATIGTVVKPQVVSWDASLQPSGGTAVFSYRAAGSASAYTSVPVTLSGGRQNASIATLTQGSYDYQLSFINSDGTVASAASGQFTIDTQSTKAVSAELILALPMATVPLSAQNSIIPQSAVVKNYAWTRSGNTLVQTAGISLDVGAATRTDNTPTQVKATIYRSDGTVYGTVYTDVGSSSGESWTEVQAGAQWVSVGEAGYGWYLSNGEGGWTPAAQYSYSATRWSAVTNWAGQVNLSAGSMPADTYTVVIETKDAAVVSRSSGALFDDTDGTWTVTNTVTATIGEVQKPNAMAWSSDVAPAGTTPTFLYRRKGGGNPLFTSAAVVTGNGMSQAAITGLPIGDYEFRIEYRNGNGDLMRAGTGAFNVATAMVTVTNHPQFAYGGLTSSASAGSSIQGYLAPAQIAAVDRVEAVVRDELTNAVVVTTFTYPQAEAGYTGAVNLSTGAVLPDGRYKISIVLHQKDGQVVTQPEFAYQVGTQYAHQQTVSWPASVQPAGTTASFSYRPVGSSGAYSQASVSAANGNQQVVIDSWVTGNYEYVVRYTDSYGRVMKTTTGTFAITATDNTNVTTTSFNYTQVTSAASAGSSISGYIPLAEVPSIDHIVATVTDRSSNSVASTASTYPEFEAGYNGDVNLKVGEALPDGKYSVAITVFYKNGSQVDHSAFNYEVGPQPYQQRTTTVSFDMANQPAGSTVSFSYARAGSSDFTTVPVVVSGNHGSVALINLPSDTYRYYVRYHDAATNAVLKESAGRFGAAASGGSSEVLRFAADLATDIDRFKQVNSFAYDAAGRLVQSTDAEGFSERFSYDAVGNKVSFSNKKGAVWSYAYDAANRLVSEISPQVLVTSVTDSLTVEQSMAGSETRMAYDAVGNVLSRTEAYGRPEARTTSYLYDALGHQTSIIYPQVGVYAGDNLATNGINGAVTRTEQNITPTVVVSYDALGRAVVNKDAAGNYSYKVYDVLGRVIYDVDANHHVTENRYDRFGNTTSVTRYATAISLDFARNIALSASEVAGLLVPGAADRVLLNEYDSLNRLVKVAEPATDNYDPSAPTGSQYFRAGRVTEKTYSSAGQVIQQRVLKNPLTNTWAETTFYYDTRGNKTAQIDALGYLTRWEYDETGDVVRQVEYAKALPAGAWTLSTHAEPETTTPQNSPASLIGYDRETRYQYDRKNQKTAETRVNVEYANTSGALGINAVVGNLTTAFAYDGVGNLTSTTDAAGSSSYIYYDALGRKTAIAAPTRASDTPVGSVYMPPLTVVYPAAANTPVRVSFARGEATGTVVSLRYRAKGTTGAWTNATLALSGNLYTADISGAQTERYEYELSYTRNGEPQAYAVGKGDIAVLGTTVSGSTNLVATVARDNLVSVSVSSAYVTQVGGGESGYWNEWAGGNSVALAWNSLEGWSNGNVRVRIEYVTQNLNGGGGAGTYRDFSFSHSTSLNGVQVSWGDGAGDTYGGIAAISGIKVWKQINGQEVLVHSSAGTATGGAGNRLVLQGNTSGVTAIDIAGIGTRPVTALAGGALAVTVGDLPRGTYQYTLVGSTAPGGSFEILESTVAGGPVLQETKGTNTQQLAITDLPADTAKAVLKYRRQGDTGGYLSKPLALNAGSWRAAYDDIGNGRYEYLVEIVRTGGQTASHVGTINILHGAHSLPTVTVNGAAMAQLTPLTEFHLDIFGNTVEQVDYARGALSANDASYGLDGLDPVNDKKQFTFFDSHGRTVRAVDAEGASQYSSYDILGRQVKEWSRVEESRPYVVQGVELLDNALAKAAANGWDNGRASTVRSYTGGATIQATAGQINLDGMFGLNTDPTGIQTFGSLDYAWRFGANGILQIVENGTVIGDFGSYAKTDLLAVAYDGNNVRYLLNGVVKRTVAASANVVLHGDTNLYSQGFKLNNVRFAPIQTPELLPGTGVSVSGGTIVRDSGAGWNADAYSKDSYTGRAQVSATVAQTTMNGMFGLNSDPAADQNYTSIDYAWHPTPGGALYIYESGSSAGSFGTYTTTDVLSIDYEGTNVVYRVNGVVKRTVATTGNRTFYFDSSLYNTGFTLRNVQFSGGGADLTVQGQNAVRVFEYDRTGNQIATVEPSYVPNAALNGVATGLTLTQASLSSAITNSAYYYDVMVSDGEYGYHYETQFSATSSIRVDWNTQADLGDGEVMVTVDYVRATGGTNTVTQTFSGASAYTSATLSWSDGGSAYGVSSVTRARVWKKDTAGNWVQIHDRAGNGAYGSQISFAAPDKRIGVSLRYRALGETPWTTATLSTLGAKSWTSLAGVANGTYEYELLYTGYNDSAPSNVAKGQIVVNGSTGSVSNESVLSRTPLNPDAFVRTEVRYNAFGEITAKGNNGGWQETYEYDNSGSVWRSQDKDGVARVFLHDGLGNTTSEIRSAQLDLGSYASATAAAALATGVQRTDVAYDLLGRAIQRDLPAYSVDRSIGSLSQGLAATAQTVSFSASSNSGYSTGEYGSGWSGNSSISVSWADLSAYGAGNVQVIVDYVTASYTLSTGGEYGYNTTYPGVATSQAVELSSASGATGTTFSWADSGAYGGIAGVTRVRVSKKDAAGNWVLIHDRNASGANGNLLSWPVPAALDTAVSFKFRVAGNGTWTTGNIIRMGARYIFDPRSLANGNYEYDLTYTRAGESTPSGQATGSFVLNGSNLTVSGGAGSGAVNETIDPVINTSFDRWGNLLTTTDPRNANWVTSNRYNSDNKLVEQKLPTVDVWGANGMATAANPTVRSYYDAAGRAVATVDANGNVNTVRYDAAGQMVAEYHADGGVVKYQYDIFGRKIRTVDAIGNATDYQYDREDQLVRQKRQIGEENYAYDTAGNRIRETDALGKTTAYWYDTRGKVIRARQPMGQETVYAYDARGNKIKETNANGDTQTWAYDYAGHLLGHVDLGGASFSYAYNRNGQLTAQTSSRGQNLTYSYYENGQLKQISDLGPTLQLVANNTDNVSITGNSARKTGGTAWSNAEVSSANGITGQAYVAAKAGQTNLHGMFGLNGDPKTDQNYTSLDYAWYATPSGNLYIYENGGNVGSFGTYTTSDVLSITYEGTNVVYRQNGVVKRTVTTTAGRTFYLDSSFYDNGFQLNNIEFKRTVSDDTFYEYDAAGNRTREKFTRAGTNYQDVTISFDALGRMTQVRDNSYTLTYSYDANGNRRRTQSSYYDENNVLKNVDNWYLYDSMNRITLAQGGLPVKYAQVDNAANPVLVTSGDVTVNAGTLTKVAGGNGWNTDITSTASLTGAAYVAAKAGQTNTSAMFGLNADPHTDQSYSSLDYAWYTAAGVAYIYENGGSCGSFGAYTTNDILSITYEGTSVVYRINGVAKRTVTTTAGRTFFFDSSLHDQGASYNNVQFGANATEAAANPISLTTALTQVSGNTISKISGGTAWNADVTSTVSVTGSAFVSASAAQNNKAIMFGLNADPVVDRSYSSIDYAWYPNSDGNVYIYESGGNAGNYGAYTASDVFTITYEGTSVVYRMNGVIKRTVVASANRTFFFDSSFNQVGGALNNVRFGASDVKFVQQPFDGSGTVQLDTSANPALIAGSDFLVNGSSVTKAAGGTAWNADATSATSLTGGAHVSAKAGQTNKGIMFGLNADPNADQSYSSIDYAWYTASDGNAYIYENGGSPGSFGAYTVNDVFTVTYEGSSVVYRINGVAKRTVSTTANRSFYLDSSFYEAGGTLNELRFGANAAAAEASPVNLVTSPVAIAGNTISKVSGGTAWNADASSAINVTGAAFVSASAVTTNKGAMFGLNADARSDHSYASLDYAWYTASDGVAYIYENGGSCGSFGAYTTNDVFSVTYEGSSVVYRMNGVVKRTVTTTADRSFYFDSSFYEVGAAIKDVHFGSGAPKGVQLAYDAAGNRRTATTMEGGYLATESYNYDANNRLVSTARAGSTTSLRSYDAAGQVIEQTTFSSPGTVSERRVSSYNSNGWVTEQNVYNGSGTRTQRTLHTGYDGVGNNTNYQVSVYTGTNYTNYYATTYAKFDSYKESKVAGTSTYFGAGATTTSYDQNGNITAVSETFATSKNRTFVTDQSGHILQKTENGKTQNYFYANDKPLGDSGALGGADFDYNYTPVSDQFPGNVPGNYVVSAGDTLRGIALAMFGDAQLWYLIADANGLKSDADLRVGLNLVMPNKVTNLRNAHDTFKPYEPGKIIGDTTPTLPNPPPPPAPKKKGKKGCGGVGAIVVAVVAIVATVMTAGALAGVAAQGFAASAAALGGSVAAGTVAAGSIAATLGTIGTALVAGAVGSIASQAVGMALGVQDKFSWSGVAMSAIGAGIGASGIGQGVAGSVAAATSSPLLGQVAAGMVGSVVTQGLGIAVGAQKSFSWAGVAAAGVGSGVGYGVGLLTKGIDSSLVRGTLSGLANGAARAAVAGGRVNWGAVAADAFGNALGNSIVGSMSSNTNSQQETTLEKALRDATAARPIDWSKGIQLADAGNVMSDAMSPTEEALLAVRESSVEGMNRTVSENRHPVIDDADQVEVFLKSLGQGKSVDDAYATANLVDVKRHVDKLSDLIATNPEDPQRDDWVKTRKVMTDALISKDVYFGESIQEILPKGINRMDDSALAKIGTSYTNADFQNKAGWFGALYENTNTESGTPTYIFGNRGTESGGAGLRDWLTNFTQAFGFKDEQFTDAVNVGRKLYKQLDGDMSFTGHSLGGGLAAAQAMRVNGTAITFNAEGLSDGTIRRNELNTMGADQRITAFYVNGEVLSRLQDSPVSSAITLGLGTVPKNIFALGGVIGDVFSGERPSFSSVGLPIVASAPGTRVEMPAFNLAGQQLGVWDRLTDTVSLHFMDYALKSMQTQLQPNGALPSSYLKNIH